MAGAFQTSRDIFSSPIWKNIVDFRMFFLIYGNAVFAEEGFRLSEDLTLQRGQWCRSTRKLQEDLVYIENRQIKKYSTSVINRCIKRLEKDGRLTTRTHELGTVFTVTNYNEYQFLGNKFVQLGCSDTAVDMQLGCTKTDELGTPTEDGKQLELQDYLGHDECNLEHNLEHSGNSGGTLGEHSGNNNKNVKNDKNVKKEKINKIHYSEFVSLTEEEYQKLIDEHGLETTTEAIRVLNSYKGANGKKYKSDYLAMLNWVFKRVQEDKIKVFPYRNRPQSPQNPKRDIPIASERSGKSLSDEEMNAIIQKAERWEEKRQKI